MILNIMWFVDQEGSVKIHVYVGDLRECGAVHKVRHAILGQFLPPLPLSHFVTHPGTPKSTSHISDPPPIF